MAGTGRETEIKLRFDDEQAAARVRELLDPESRVRHPIEQTNHFFETPDRRLRGAGIGLRLRREVVEAPDQRRETWILTAKGPAAGRPPRDDGAAERPPPTAFTSRAEEEAEVEAGLAADILAGRVKPLAALEQTLGRRPELLEVTLRALEGAEPAVVGSFKNTRWPLPWVVEPDLELLIELDRTEFPGARGEPHAPPLVHHEVEVELPPELAPEAIQRALADLLERAGTQGFASRGKASRFFEALDGPRG